MNISNHFSNFNQNYNNKKSTPVFQGGSHNLHCAMDNFLSQENHTPESISHLIKKIKDSVPSFFKPSRELGEGTHCTVYKVTPKYVARVPNEFNPQEVEKYNDLKINHALFKSMPEYYGEPIVELGNIQILPNVGNAVAAGIPEHKAKKMTHKQLDNYYSRIYLPKFASVTQKGYDDLADNFLQLNGLSFGYRSYGLFDSLNPNNILLKKNKFYLVDEIDKGCDMSWSNSTAKIFELLMNKSTCNTPSPVSDKNQNLYRKMFKKIILATDKHGIINANSRDDIKNWEMALKRCGIQEDAVKVVNTLDKIHFAENNQKKREVTLNKYINELFTKK